MTTQGLISHVLEGMVSLATLPRDAVGSVMHHGDTRIQDAALLRAGARRLVMGRPNQRAPTPGEDATTHIAGLRSVTMRFTVTPSFPLQVLGETSRAVTEVQRVDVETTVQMRWTHRALPPARWLEGVVPTQLSLAEGVLETLTPTVAIRSADTRPVVRIPDVCRRVSALGSRRLGHVGPCRNTAEAATTPEAWRVVPLTTSLRVNADPPTRPAVNDVATELAVDRVRLFLTGCLGVL